MIKTLITSFLAVSFVTLILASIFAIAYCVGSTAGEEWGVGVGIFCLVWAWVFALTMK